MNDKQFKQLEVDIETTYDHFEYLQAKYKVQRGQRWEKPLRLVPFNPQPKIEPARDEKYLDFIRKKSCEVCALHGDFTKETISAHHPRRLHWGAGGSIKPHDYCCISMCEKLGHHNPKYEKEIDLERIIINNQTRYAIKNGWEMDLIDCLVKFLKGKKGGK